MSNVLFHYYLYVPQVPLEQRKSTIKSVIDLCCGSRTTKEKRDETLERFSTFSSSLFYKLKTCFSKLDLCEPELNFMFLDLIL